MLIVPNTHHQLVPMGYCASSSVLRPMATTCQQGNSSVSPTPEEEEDKLVGHGAYGVIWAVTDPRDNKRKALKRIRNVFRSVFTSKCVYRELRLMAGFDHDNVLCLDDIVYPSHDLFAELYILTELMQTDLAQILASPQILTQDHVQLFLYQLLRGLKYIHSAGVLHRDLKPNNLLVNSNCCLKICDFGQSRIYHPDEDFLMTTEIVTQFYRPPEILMGAARYTCAVDIWSAACIFAELLSRRILFYSVTPVQQLEMIVQLVGTPNVEDMKWACEGARCFVMRLPYYPPNVDSLRRMYPLATRKAISLLRSMLTFDPKKRMTAAEALTHCYLNNGRKRYHHCMCTCCKTVPDTPNRQFCQEREPTSPKFLSCDFDAPLVSTHSAREYIWSFIKRFSEQRQKDRQPVVLNPSFVNLGKFLTYQPVIPGYVQPPPWQC